MKFNDSIVGSFTLNKEEKKELPALEEGDRCPKCDDGQMELMQELCYCIATNAPYSNCENAWLECSACHWREYD